MIFFFGVLDSPLNIGLNFKKGSYAPDFMVTEYGSTLSLKLNNEILPTRTPKTLGITFDPKLIFSQHINLTVIKA